MKKGKNIPTVSADSYPMRINKYLAHKGIATRTGVDELIKHQKILINGRVAKLGDKVLETDKIEVRGVHTKKKYVYIAYNKPKGVVSTNPQDGEKNIIQSIKLDTKVFPVGRLDKESHGLMILTNDGRITDRLLNPIYNHEKEYIVRTSNKLRGSFKQKMETGVNIEGYITKKCKVKIINDFTFRIILTEGKKHQIRRMCSALFQEIADLKRERIMNIKIGNLKSNAMREIKGEELAIFLKSISFSFFIIFI